MTRAVELQPFGFAYSAEPRRRVRGSVHRLVRGGELPWVLILHGFNGFQSKCARVLRARARRC